MPMPGVHVETLHNATHYSPAQIEAAFSFAAVLNRGRLVLCERPAREPLDEDDTG